jgi:hypothetical protein
MPDALAEPQPAPGAAHPTARFLLVDALDPRSENFIEWPDLAFPRLVIGRGAGQPEPLAKAADGKAFSRREQVLLNPVHEFASGSGFPRMSLAIIQTSFSMVIRNKN